MYQKSRTFVLSRNTDIDCFLNFLTIFESLRVVLRNVLAIFMMSQKLATLGLLKRKIFLNKRYDVMIYAHGVTNKFSLNGLNHIVDMVMLPKFGNCSIFMRDVIIASIL